MIKQKYGNLEIILSDDLKIKHCWSYGKLIIHNDTAIYPIYHEATNNELGFFNINLSYLNTKKGRSAHYTKAINLEFGGNELKVLDKYNRLKKYAEVGILHNQDLNTYIKQIGGIVCTDRYDNTTWLSFEL